MQQKGRFITFEGGEGTGKSTQLRLLAEYLERAGVTNVMSKEPGGTEIGQELRRILVTGDKDKFDAVTECLLYYADRRIHLTSKVWPALEKGSWVLSDRFADSTVACITVMTKKCRMKPWNPFIKLPSADLSPI